MHFYGNHRFVTFLGLLRASTLLLYLGGLFGPCLSSCLAPEPVAASHECCQSTDAGQVVRAPAKDCCATHDPAPAPTAAALHAAPPAVINAPALAAETFALPSPQTAVRTAAPPPLALRI